MSEEKKKIYLITEAGMQFVVSKPVFDIVNELRDEIDDLEDEVDKYKQVIDKIKEYINDDTVFDGSAMCKNDLDKILEEIK